MGEGRKLTKRHRGCPIEKRCRCEETDKYTDTSDGDVRRRQHLASDRRPTTPLRSRAADSLFIIVPR